MCFNSRLGVTQLTGTGTPDTHYRDALQDIQAFDITWVYFSAQRTAKSISKSFGGACLYGLAIFCPFSNWVRYARFLGESPERPA